jgi:hypothetical protein
MAACAARDGSVVTPTIEQLWLGCRIRSLQGMRIFHFVIPAQAGTYPSIMKSQAWTDPGLRRDDDTGNSL